MHPNVLSSTIYNSEGMEATQVSIERWLDKEDLSIYLYIQETWVWFLGWEDPQEKVMATHSSILVWRNLWTEEPGTSAHGVAKSGTQLSN